MQQLQQGRRGRGRLTRLLLDSHLFIIYFLWRDKKREQAQVKTEASQPWRRRSSRYRVDAWRPRDL